MQNGRARLLPLDGLRGLAVLMVVWWHYFNSQAGIGRASPTGMKLAWQSTSLFWSGVDLFFVLSGFLITRILLNESSSRNLLPVFFLRRAVRILPLYFLVLIFAGATYLLIGSRPQFNWLYENLPPVSSFLTFTQNIVMGAQSSFGGRFLGMTWSLAVEEQFYLIWPFIVLFCGSRRHLLITSLALCLLAPCLRLGASHMVAMVNMPYRLDSLLWGAIAAILVGNARFVSFIRSNPRSLRLVLVMLALAFLVMTRFNRIFGVLDHFILAVFYTTLLLHCVILSEGRLARMFSAGWLRWFGVLSYGIYMFHEPVAGLLHGAIRGAEPSITTMGGLLLTVFSFGLVLAAAALSMRFFESRFLEWGRRFHYLREDERATGTAITTHLPIATSR